MHKFEITVQRRAGAHWPVFAEEAEDEVFLPVRTEGVVDLDLADLAAAEPNDYGVRLGEALFRGGVRDAFSRAWGRTEEDLRILLQVEDEELRALRWERLHAPIDGGWRPLALQQRAPFSQSLPSSTDRRFAPIRRADLRMLILAASPAGLAGYRMEPFDEARAVEAVRSALGSRVDVDVLGTVPDSLGLPTLDELCARLTAGRYTLLHVVCHGAVRGGETVLYLADGAGRAAPVAASTLVERLRILGGAHGLPHFAFLSSCESAAASAEGALGGLAHRFVRDLGIPAVLAMTDRISVETSLALASAFYGRLFDHGEVDRALAEACAGLAGRPDVVVPVPALFSRLGGRPLFREASVGPAPDRPRLRWKVPPSNPHFLDLHDTIGRLDAALKDGARVALTGLAGVGKTQAAIAYAHRRRGDYSATFWVNAESEGSIAADVASIARGLDLAVPGEATAGDVTESLRVWLDTPGNGGWLLIIDNANDLELARSLFPTAMLGRILLTTTDPTPGRVVDRAIELSPLGPDEGAHALLTQARLLDVRSRLEAADPAHQDAARALSIEMGGLMLAIDQAAAFIEDTPCTPAEYLRRYEQRGTRLRRERGSHRDHESVAATFSLAFERLVEKRPVSGDLLRLCAFLDPAAIPETILLEGAAVLDDPLRSALLEDDLLEVIAPAHRARLLRRDPGSRTLTLHRVVRDVLRDLMDDTAQRRWAHVAVRAVNHVVPEIEFHGRNLIEKYHPHLQACVSNIDQFKLASREAGRVLDKAGCCAFYLGRYDEAESLVRRAFEISRQQSGMEHPETARSLNNLAAIAARQGKFEIADDHWRQALTIRERVLGEDHPDTWTSLNNLGVLYQLEGKLDDAEALFRQALARFDRGLPPDHPNIATALGNLANVAVKRRRWNDAETFLLRALSIRERSQGPYHPETDSVMESLVSLYADSNMNKDTDAERILRRLLEAREQRLGPDDLRVAACLNSLGEIHFDRNDHAGAERLYRRGYDIFRRVRGDDQPDTATCLLLVADACVAQGHFEEADPLLRQVLEVREATLGPSDKDTTEALHKYLAALLRRGRRREANSVLKRVDPARASEARKWLKEMNY